MAKKEEQKNVTHTPFYYEVINKLKELGRTVTSPETVAFMVDEEKDDICVDINFMTTGLHYNKKNVTKEDVVAAGFRWCSTWNFIF